MPRPSPFLLHGWLRAWWKIHRDDDATLQVHVARRDGRLVGAIPLYSSHDRGLTVVRFLGGENSSLADILLAADSGPDVSAALAHRVEQARHDLVDLYGLPSESRLAAALGDGLRLLQRSEAPVLDLRPGWDTVYRAKLSSKRRSMHRKRLSQLGELGAVEVTIARTLDELEPALEDALRLHSARWASRPDGSTFAQPLGPAFQRAALPALAGTGVARIARLLVDGRPAAFRYYFLLEGRMVGNGTGYDVQFASCSPGWLLMLAALEAAASEGADTVEFLGGDEPYKLQFADRLDPLYEAIGLPGSARGKVAATCMVRTIQLRRRLRESERLRRFYYDGLAPVRRARQRLRRVAGSQDP